MPPEPVRPQTPSELGGSGEPADARLLQDRLRLFGGITFLIAAAFYAVGLVLGGLGIQSAFDRVGHAAMWVVFLLTGGTWLYCSGGARSGRTLRAVDALLMAALGGLVLLTRSGSIPEADVRRMVVLAEVLLVVFTRSIFIPSSARRTLAEKVGEGGMGVVYRARHAMLRRPTAVKLLRPERVGEASLRRFEREVQLTAGLSHPNTISVFDYGRTPDGVFYYAMEYLDGLTLDEIVAGDGPQPPARVVHVVRQILGALGEAHGIGLVHRDVKPGNVILCERGGIPDVAKVLDFGLVKEIEGEPGVTHEGALVGTPLFLAPEAIRSGDARPRSDVYAVGAVAYYLLCGRHVFEGKSVVAVCGHNLHTAPTPPSKRMGRPLPAALEAWVLACLEKDPERRPRSAADAASRLDACALDDSWTVDAARVWWASRGRSIAAGRAGSGAPSAPTLSRSVLEKADDSRSTAPSARSHGAGARD